jgi:phosphotriesterase-related protein
MTNGGQSGMAQTVLGLVRPEELGPTTTHEHLLIDFKVMYTPPTEATELHKSLQPVSLENLAWVRYDQFRSRDNMEIMDEELSISEALLFKGHGGKTIVDATTIGIGRDPFALARIARATGLNVIMGAGYYVGVTHPDGLDAKSADEIGAQIVEELTTGVGNTRVKAGIIGELGCSWPLDDNERNVLIGGAIAQQETGAAILIHPGRNPKAPFEILDVLEAAGADIGRVIMGHLDRTIFDDDQLLELAARGSYLEYDLWGWETSYYPLGDIDIPTDAQRIVWVKMLIDAGYGERIVLAHDVFSKTRLVAYGGFGMGHILENIVPRMRQKGISEAEIDNMLVNNPARILTFA